MFIKKSVITLALVLGWGISPLVTFAQDRNDPLFQSGARELGASGEDQELKKQGLDALARAKQTGKLTACADGASFPYSTSDGEPPGFDIEIFRGEISRLLGDPRGGEGAAQAWVKEAHGCHRDRRLPGVSIARSEQQQGYSKQYFDDHGALRIRWTSRLVVCLTLLVVYPESLTTKVTKGSDDQISELRALRVLRGEKLFPHWVAAAPR